jgi:eukaryotic-like serine/threonine-protein kinase
MQRFIQEAKAASALNHPNILTIYGIGQEASACFIATEYIDGVTLRERLLKERLEINDVLGL